MALTDKLTAIANAIRAKTGKTESLTLEQMPTEIESITTGGGDGEKPFDCHSVTFMYGDTVLYVRSVGDGDTCADPVSRNLIQAPTKESTTQYDYTHNGWASADGGAADDTILQNVTEDKTVYAAFKETLREYTITFYDEDGTTVLATEQVAYGTVPSYTPTKEGAVFGGWTTELVAVTGDASYIVIWLTTILAPTVISSTAWAGSTPHANVEANGMALESGKTYTFTWDGVAYTCEAGEYKFQKSVSSSPLGVSGLGIGNATQVKQYNNTTIGYRKKNGAPTYNTGEPAFIKYRSNIDKFEVYKDGGFTNVVLSIGVSG